MPQPPSAPGWGTPRYGAIGLHGPNVVDAPDLTRIPLATLLRDDRYTVDDDGIVVAGQVWYVPFDVDPVTLALICTKARDNRPLLTQAQPSC